MKEEVPWQNQAQIVERSSMCPENVAIGTQKVETDLTVLVTPSWFTNWPWISTLGPQKRDSNGFNDDAKFIKLCQKMMQMHYMLIFIIAVNDNID